MLFIHLGGLSYMLQGREDSATTVHKKFAKHSWDQFAVQRWASVRMQRRKDKNTYVPIKGGEQPRAAYGSLKRPWGRNLKTTKHTTTIKI